MEKDKEVTNVIFRKWKNGDIIALFPDICEDVNGNANICRSYMCVGQHGAANYLHVIAITKLVKEPKEYESLFLELESLGYNLKVKERMQWTKYK